MRSMVSVSKNKMGIEVVNILCQVDETWRGIAEIRLDHTLCDPWIFEGLVKEYWWDPEEGTSLDLFHVVYQAFSFWLERLALIAYSEELGYREILRVGAILDTPEEWELVQIARGWWDDPTGQTEGWEVILTPEERQECERWASRYLEEIWAGKFNCPASYIK